MATHNFNFLEEAHPPRNILNHSDRGEYNFKYSKSPTNVRFPKDILTLPEDRIFTVDLRDKNSNIELKTDNIEKHDRIISTLNSNEQIQLESVNNQRVGNLNNDSNHKENVTNGSTERKHNRNVTYPRHISKSNSCREPWPDKMRASTETKRSTSSLLEQYRKRSSYHRDVEEALSSLLWQPYEYRSTRSDSSDTLSSTLSSISSSCASLSTDSAARSIIPSFTDEFLNVTTSLPAYQHSGNSADPNLSLQMVTNLMALKSRTVGAYAAQSDYSIQSRGSDGGSGASQVDWERSRECAFVLCSEYNTCRRTSTITLATDSNRNTLRCDNSATDTVFSCVRDEAVLSAVSDMRVEIPGLGSQPPAPEVANRKPPDVLQHSGTQVFFQNVAGDNGGQTRQGALGVGASTSAVSEPRVSGGGAVPTGDTQSKAVYMQSGQQCPISIGLSSDMIPSNITSVVSANVVGLPVHSRSSSNLSNGRGDIVQPNHPRSVSETVNSVFIQHHLGAHFRSNSNVSNGQSGSQSHQPDRNNHCGLIPVPNHPRQSSTSSQHQMRGMSEPPINITHSSDVHNVKSERRSSAVPNTCTNDLNLILNSGERSTDTRTVTVESSVQTSRIPPLPNVNNVNVNFYRAVPVNVISNVPTIHCSNSVEEAGNNVSNVHIVQAMPTSVPSISVAPATEVSVQQTATVPSFEVRTRTFTSTEAQTDDIAVGALVSPTTAVNTVSSSREQRRRERRERRHQRRLNSSNHPHGPTQGSSSPNDRLPDLLNSHLPPPYTTLPSSLSQNPVTTMVPPNTVLPNTVVAGSPVVAPSIVPFHPGAVPLVPGPPPVPIAAPSGFRFPFPSAVGFRRCRARLGPRYSEEQPKSCCGLLISRPGSLRWFIALIALVAVCCVLVGTVLGAMRPAGRDHLTVSLLMIGVGIVLVTVSGVAWRLTSHDAPSCRAMLGLESNESTDICTRRFVPRLPPSYGRPHHPYAAMIYPEFQYRPPPPSYQASMQEYRLRLLLLDRGNTPQIQSAQHAVSPPPTYRSHAGSLLRAPLSSRRDAAQSEYSCPPSYRSRSSSNRPAGSDTIVHSREQSLTLSESNQDESVVNVVSILTNQEEEITLDTMALDSLKLAPDTDNLTPLRMLLKSSSGSDLVETSTKDGNLVTIVQKDDQNPVIVTVSGSQMSTTNPEVGSSNQVPSEMEILAHL